MNLSQAKAIDIVTYLSSLGFAPAKISGNNYWFRSPLREEKTASFKVDRKQNIWYDHGTGVGGTLIDFGIRYHNCTIRELLQKLNGSLSFHPQNINKDNSTEQRLIILCDKVLESIELMRYINQRRVATEVAQKYCREIRFQIRDKKYNAIGFANDAGGWELRNAWFKGSSAPKATTIINKGAEELFVFEGFFDFLSYQSLTIAQQSKHPNFLILNSVSFFEKSRQWMEKHDRIRLFLDRDKAGLKLTEAALQWSKKYSDESTLYKGHKDFNEWMQQIGKLQRRGLRP